MSAFTAGHPFNLVTAPAPRSIRGIALLLIAMVAGFAWLYTAHNTFPYFCHTDESGKTEQILKHRRNYHHPQLMLVATSAATSILHTALGLPKTPQNVVVAGRWYSGICAALAVGGVAVLLARSVGWIFGVLGGALVGFHPLPGELSHYMKEDCGLLLGLVVTFLALDRFHRGPSRASALALGAAAGFAVSAKYIAILCLPVVVGLGLVRIWDESAATKRRIFGRVALGFLGVFVFINWQAILHFRSAVAGASREFGVIKPVIASDYGSRIFEILPAPLLVIALSYALWVLSRRRAADATDWGIMAFSALYLLSIHFSALERNRYLLPLVLTTCLFAVKGIAVAANAARRRWATILGALVCAAFVGSEIPQAIAVAKAFRFEHWTRLLAWMDANLPAEAVVAHDLPRRFRNAGDRFIIPRRTLNSQNLSDLGGIAQIKAQGVRYVILTPWDFQPRNTSTLPDPNANRDLCLEILKTGRTLWEAKGSNTVTYLHPQLYVVELP